MINAAEYYKIRSQLVDTPNNIIALEHQYMKFLVDAIGAIAAEISTDFDEAIPLKPFWINYAPRQRGRAPSRMSIPWSEVGETAIGANIVRALSKKNTKITFPGLPSGADIRFKTSKAIVHLDVKVTGPNDRADEIVASPNQISGDGKMWADGIINSAVEIKGQRSKMQFQPELPPFYIEEGAVFLCLTYFLKGVYIVIEYGEQPLSYLELICVPNGLLAFDGPNYVQHEGLFIPGKDVRSHNKKRTRVRMEPLANLDAWRRQTLWESSSK